ncbi:MAG: tetratricopeptide repeat protein [Candidatus Aminicenantales bacterium]
MKMKFFYFAFLAFFLLSCSNNDGVIFQKISLDEALKKARREDKLVLIDFFSTTCIPCVKLSKTVFRDPAMSRFINRHFVSLKITSELSDDKDIRKKYNVWGLPTVLFLENSGRERDRNCGYDGDKDKYFKTITDYAANENTLSRLISAYESAPLDVENNYRLALKHVNRWEYEQDSRYFENVLKLDPTDRYGYRESCLLNIAINAFRDKKDIGPIQSFIQTSSNPEFLSVAYDYLLGFLESEADAAQYLATCETAVDRIPKKDVAYWRLVNYYNAKKDSVMLLKTLDRTVANLPEDAGYLNQYAWAIYEYHVKDQYPKAIQMAQKALELEPGADSIWDTLARIYYETGDKDKAIKAMKKAARLNPKKKSYQESLQKFRTKR